MMYVPHKDNNLSPSLSLSLSTCAMIANTERLILNSYRYLSGSPYQLHAGVVCMAIHTEYPVAIIIVMGTTRQLTTPQQQYTPSLKPDHEVRFFTRFLLIFMHDVAYPGLFG